MNISESIDKIVEVYLASVTTEAFEYKGIIFFPKPLVVSPLIFRDYACPPFCGACCLNVTLDYLPEERKTPHDVKERFIYINDKSFAVYSNLQEGNTSHYCQFLDSITGRCAIHDYNPMSCAFALLAFTQRQDKNYLSLRKFGRSWALTKVTGEKNTACELLPPSPERIQDTVLQLVRLLLWCDHFELKNKLVKVIKYVSSGPHEKPLIII